MKHSEDKKNNLYKVLIIDDDINMLKIVERYLFNKNYIIYSESSGKEALKKIKAIEPDIILLDIIMPEIDGFQVCEIIKKDESLESIPIIFITEAASTDNIVKAFDYGAVDYIIKPFNAKALLARIDTHLQLKRYQETLKEVNQVKMKFFSIMTNDIKDSLIGVKGIASFLVQDLEDGCQDSTEGIKMAKILRDDSKQLYELLENLIDWASIETGQIKIKPQDIKVYDLVTNTVQFYESYLNNKSLKLVLRCNQDVVLHSDYESIRIVLLKIISNAIKYSQQNGTINIVVERVKNKCIFSVIDQGVGMEADVVKNIFRLDTPHPKTIGTADEKGTGLGLVICHSLIERLGGNIKIESKKFRGASVVFEIPDFEA